MRIRRNFGTMHPDWQDRKNKKRLIGFRVTFQDGTTEDIRGGLSTIPDQTIREHGHVMKAKEIGEE